MYDKQVELKFLIKLSTQGSYDITQEKLMENKYLCIKEYLENEGIYVDKLLDKETESSTRDTGPGAKGRRKL